MILDINNLALVSISRDQKVCFTRAEILFGFQKHLRIDAHSILRFDRGHRWDRADDHSQISFGAKLKLLSLTIKGPGKSLEVQK